MLHKRTKRVRAIMAHIMVRTTMNTQPIERKKLWLQLKKKLLRL
ncbi:hypothetical protein HMPREF3190_00960 [Umbribacter vaginalis]|nr:hypothetical protein HMPREF3190_00960 [Coriobacteriales bacterium DNF00809]